MEPMPARGSEPVSLAYATPDRATRRSTSGTWGIVLVTLVIVGGSVAVFGIVNDSMHRASVTDTYWPAAFAVTALAAMGTALGYFLTRTRDR